METFITGLDAYVVGLGGRTKLVERLVALHWRNGKKERYVTFWEWNHGAFLLAGTFVHTSHLA